MASTIQANAALLSSLIAYYKVEGNVTDSHGSNNGTAEKAISTVSGALRNCIALDGNGDPQDAIGTCQALNLGQLLADAQSFSLSYWANLNSVTANSVHASQASWNGADFHGQSRFVIQQPSGSSGNILFRYWGDAGSIDVSFALTNGAWVHWAFTIDYNPGTGSTAVAVYKNGYLIGSNSGIVGAPRASTIPTLIGALPWDYFGANQRAQQANGKIDEIAAANRSWTAEEVRFLYHTGYPVHYDEVLALTLASLGGSGVEDMRNLALLEPGLYFLSVTDLSVIAGPAYRQVSLSWVNPVSSDFLEVIVRRSITAYPPSPSSGDLAYQGTGTGFLDDDLDRQLYYYSVFSSNIYHDYSEAVTGSATVLDPDRAKLVLVEATAKDKVQATFDQEMRLGEDDSTDVLKASNWTFETLAHGVSATLVTLVQASPTIIDIQLDGEGTAGETYDAVIVATAQSFDLRTIDPTAREFEFIGLGEMPQVTDARSTGLFRVLVQFSEPVLGADDGDNYEIDGLIISGAYLFNVVLHQYVVRTNQQTPEALYEVVVSGVTDLAGGPIDPAHCTYEFIGYSPTGSDAAHPQDQGLIEALTGAIGEACTEMAGLVSTRLLTPILEGATTFVVETTEGWPAVGRCAVEGVPYTYTGKTATSFTGIQHIRAGESTAGAAMIHHVEAEVTDISRERSFMEQLRRAMLINYADGEDLNVIGRNFGLIRHPVFTEDDVYREVIRGVAYNPKGSMLGLELALTGMAGAGNFEVYEDLIRYPCQVFVRLTGDALTHSAQKGSGKAWLTELYWDALRGTAETLDLSATPLFVYGVQLKPLQEVFDFRTVRPSDVVYPYYPGITPASAFTYAGALSEGTSVAVENGQTKLTAGSAGTVYYRMLDTQGARLTAESDWVVALLLSIPTAATLKAGELEQASLAVSDGAFRISAGLGSDLAFGLFATSGGGFLGTTVTLSRNTYYTAELKKTGAWVELYLNGQSISRVAYSAFSGAPNTDHRVELGIRGAPNSGMALWVKQLRASIQTPTDYWSDRGVDGEVLTANPVQLDIGGTTHTFLATDVGKPLRTYGSAAANAQGGSNNGRWRIATYVSPTEVTLRGIERADAQTSSGAPTQITIPWTDGRGSFVYPDDLGKSIVISGSHSGKDGTYLITQLFNPDTGADYATETFSGTKRARTCQVSAATFTTEVGLTWELLPNFVDESGLPFEQSGAGSFSGTVLTLREPLWANDLVMEILAIDEHAAQMLTAQSCITRVNSEGPPPTYSYYPWFIVDPLGMLRPFVDQLTVAGVVPEYFIGGELYGY